MNSDDYPVYNVPERNPVTHAQHRKEVFRQITIPLLIGVLVMLALCALPVYGLAAGAGETVSRWGAISLIWLIIPTMIFGLIALAFNGGLAYAVIALIRVLPRQFRRLQDLFVTIGSLVRQVMDKLVEPVLKAQSAQASLQALRRASQREMDDLRGR